MLLPTHAKLPNRRLHILLILIAFVIGIFVAIYTYQKIDILNRTHLTDRANSIATTIPAETIQTLAGSPQDSALPAYQTLKNLLIRLRGLNHDVRFIYLVGQHNNEFFFYADSEPQNSPDYSPPGELYPEAPLSMHQAYSQGISLSDGPTRDRWGLWVSGYAPIIDEHGSTIALLGIDVPGKQYMLENIVYAAFAFMIVFVFLFVLLTERYNRIKERYYLMEKSEFLSIAAHEIRTPIIGIKWVLEDLLSTQKNTFDEGTISIVTLAAQNAARLLERLNNLLTTTRLEGARKNELHTETFPLKQLLTDVMSNLSLSAKGRNVTLIYDDHAAPQATITGDKEDLRYAFSNLISNAIKYTKQNSKVTITVAQGEKTIGVKVTDEGNGIPVQEQKHIFEGFHRADAAVASGQPGTGIGLYLTKKIIELHHGTISLISQTDKGSSFICTFPRS